jgi:hypothetical protein
MSRQLLETAVCMGRGDPWRRRLLIDPDERTVSHLPKSYSCSSLVKLTMPSRLMMLILSSRFGDGHQFQQVAVTILEVEAAYLVYSI